jgi:hypothetical protein
MKEHRKSTKNDEIAVDESVDLDVPKDDLPKDAKFIGKRRVVVQELEIRRRNIEFWIHRYWSAELGKVIEGALLESSRVNSSVLPCELYQCYKNRVPHEKIRRNLANWGIVICSETINARVKTPRKRSGGSRLRSRRRPEEDVAGLHRRDRREA